jgi:outer membrane protein assembly factor BamD (BamD/ComL family)
MKRILVEFASGSCIAVLMLLTACGQPVRYGDSFTPPDKRLFDRALEAFQNNRIDVAAMTLQTLLNTYPDTSHAQESRRILWQIAQIRSGNSAVPSTPTTID